MADVFLSYAREDRSVAEKLASALGAEGWSAWWDRTAAPGQPFAKVIQQQLREAASVVVLWSPSSVESDWVFNEAEVGRRRAVLIPSLIGRVEASEIPIPFQHIQAADLIDWAGEREHVGVDAEPVGERQGQTDIQVPR